MGLRMGIVSGRKRRRRLRQFCRITALAGIAVLLGIAALPLGIGEKMGRALEGSVQAFAGERRAQTEITLPGIDVYALQLAVFDSAERAAAEAQRLERLGVLCMIWQKEKLRLVSDVSLGRESLDYATAMGQEAYVIEESLSEIRLRIEAGAEEIATVKSLLLLPDESLASLIDGGTLIDEIARVRAAAEAARDTYPQHALYTALAENLIAWCDMMEKPEMKDACGYGKAAMFALCRELRQALIAQSTVSAQRTPSTAADVMPPA